MCYEPPKHQVWSDYQSQDNHGPEKLSEVLDRLNLTKYYSCFENEDIDMDTFLTLNDEDLKQIGIKYVRLNCNLFLYFVIIVLWGIWHHVTQSTAWCGSS